MGCSALFTSSCLFNFLTNGHVCKVTRWISTRWQMATRSICLYPESPISCLIIIIFLLNYFFLDNEKKYICWILGKYFDSQAIIWYQWKQEATSKHVINIFIQKKKCEPSKACKRARRMWRSVEHLNPTRNQKPRSPTINTHCFACTLVTHSLIFIFKLANNM